MRQSAQAPSPGGRPVARGRPFVAMNASKVVRARSARSRASRSKLGDQVGRGGDEAVGAGGDDVGLPGPHVQPLDVAAEALRHEQRALQRRIRGPG